MTMDEFFHEHSQQVLFCKKMNKRNRIQEIYVGLLWPICHMKCSSYTWTSISYSSLQHPNHMKFEITSNSKAHKPIDPPKGMCQFKQYLSTTKRYATIWDNIKYPRTFYHFKLFFIFICALNPLATCTIKLH
jgi:hypothetical protein